MILIRGLSPNAAYLRLLQIAVSNSFTLEQSRIGPFFDLGHVVVEMDEGERISLLEGRGTNPVFAVVEAAWLLSGSNELAPLQQILSNYGKFSDDGKTLNGAYGYRLRHYFGIDQIEAAVEQLRSHPDSRRTVMSMYAPDDLGKASADIPCNTQVICRIENGRLALTVINRSNDLWLGVPYNWFVFRALQVLLSSKLGIRPGLQRHISTCMHLYQRDVDEARKVARQNTMSSIQRTEGSTTSMDMDRFLLDVPALASGNFEAVCSAEISNLLSRYKGNRDSSAEVADSDPLEKRQSLDLAFDQWIATRKLSKENALIMTSKNTYPDSSVHLSLQKWIFSEPVEMVLSSLKVAATNVQPLIPALLSKTLPQGVQVNVDEANIENVSGHIVLGLILGSLDPMLGNSRMGDMLKERLQDLATRMQLPAQAICAHEVPVEELKRVFVHVL